MYINTTPLLLPKYYHSVSYSHLLRIEYHPLIFAVPNFMPVLISVLYLNSLTLAKKLLKGWHQMECVFYLLNSFTSAQGVIQFNLPQKSVEFICFLFAEV